MRSRRSTARSRVRGVGGRADKPNLDSLLYLHPYRFQIRSAREATVLEANSTRAGEAQAGADDALVRYGLAAVGLYLIGVSVLALVSPATFFAEIGPFGTRNDHYTRDGATFQLALGIAALVATRRADWRVPVIVTLAIQFLLHTVNHLVDIDEADPHWLGPADFAGLALGTVLLAVLLRRVLRGGRRG